MSTRRLSIIFPVYTEVEAVLEHAHQQLTNCAWLQGWKKEFIVSQNGGMKPLALSKNKFIHVVDQRKGIGVGITNGLRAASGSYYYIASPDIAFELTDLKQMVVNLTNDMVIGSKLHPDSIYDQSRLRKAGTYGLYMMRRMLIPDYTIRDPNGSLFGKTVKIVPLLEEVSRFDYFFSTELVRIALHHNLKIAEIPVRYEHNSKHHSSVRLLKDGWLQLWQTLKLRMSKKSIK
jgi:hypothetical protein